MVNPAQLRARRWLVGLVAAALALTVGAALAIASDRDALWKVVGACVADQRLTGLPFPCLAVDLSQGEGRGHILLRPPWANDLILSPTRRSVGVEDPFHQTPEAPNYFAQAWAARGMIATTNGRPPARSQIALVANSRIVRGEDQLHIHLGCLVPQARHALADAAPGLPIGAWRMIGPVVPHQPIWALRVGSADLAGVEPFRLVSDEFGRAVRDRSDLMISVVGATVDGQDDFLILVSYVGVPHSWWPFGSLDLIDPHCRGEGGEGG